LEGIAINFMELRCGKVGQKVEVQNSEAAVFYFRKPISLKREAVY
jgi:hypothetical protein